jgi:hypothetical protein
MADPKEVDKMKLRWAVAVIAAAAFGAVPAFAAPAPVSQESAIGPTLTKMAYTSKADGQADIYTMDAFGKNIFNVTHDKTIGVRADGEPVWSPTGHSSRSSGSTSRAAPT